MDGTATATNDYTAKSGTVTFNPGVGSRTIAITVLSDTIYETLESFKVTLSNPVNVGIVGSGEGN